MPTNRHSFGTTSAQTRATSARTLTAGGGWSSFPTRVGTRVCISRGGGMDLGLKGRTAIVCGASSGIGLAIAESLAGEGANVAMFARRRDLLAARGRADRRTRSARRRHEPGRPQASRRPHARGLRRNRHSRQQQRRPAADACRRDHRRPGRGRRGAAPALGDPAHEPLPAAARAQRPGPGDQHRIELGARADRQPRPLEHRAPRRDRLGEDARARGRPEEDHDQFDRAGAHRNGAAGRGLRREAPSRRSRSHPASPVRAAARGGAKSSASSPPTRRATSPARSSRSTAA